MQGCKRDEGQSQAAVRQFLDVSALVIAAYPTHKPSPTRDTHPRIAAARCCEEPNSHFSNRVAYASVAANIEQARRQNANALSHNVEIQSQPTERVL